MPPPGPSEHRFRQNSRAPVAAPVRLQFDALEEPQDGHTANISIGGMFVQAKEPRPVGTLLRFELGLGGGQPIKGVGEVVWIRPHAQGREAPAGMGIQFGHLDDANRERLTEAVRQAGGAVTDLTEPTHGPPPRGVRSPTGSAPETTAEQDSRPSALTISGRAKTLIILLGLLALLLLLLT